MMALHGEDLALELLVPEGPVECPQVGSIHSGEQLSKVARQERGSVRETPRSLLRVEPQGHGGWGWWSEGI